MILYRSVLRKEELLNLKRSRIDLKQGLIRLMKENTKTHLDRSISIRPEARGVLAEILRVPSLHSDRIFHRDGKPIKQNHIRTVLPSGTKLTGKWRAGPPFSGGFTYFGQYYRVPDEYIGRRVWTRLNRETLFIESAEKVIAECQIKHDRLDGLLW